MSRTKFIAKNHIADFNVFVSSKKYFTKEDFLRGFKTCKIPAGMWSFLRDALLVQVSRTEYELSRKPVHYKVLQDIYDHYKEHSPVSRDPHESQKIKEAAQYLISKGYQVLLPIERSLVFR